MSSTPVQSLVATSDGTFSAAWWRTSGIRIAIILVTAIVVSWIARSAVRRLRKRLEAAESHEEVLSLRRITTITSTLTNFALVAVWTVAILMVLSELNVNLAPLLASAGIVGVALSFGAQSLVRDFLVGFFVILEDQYRVGDSVSITANGGTFSGKIEDLTLRYTSVRGGDGTLYEVGNGNILFVANRSRGVGNITVDVRVQREGSLRDMERRLDRAVEEMRTEPAIRQMLSEGPTVVGVEPVDGDRVLASISARVWASRRDRTEATLRRELSRRMEPHRETDADGDGAS
jgi:small-conductance mechanosensitive channel